MTKLSALLLDRDGTIVAMVKNAKGEQDSPYFASELEFYPGLAELLTPFVKQDIPIFIVTNQPGIAKGHFEREDLKEAHASLAMSLYSSGIPIREILSCIHHPVGMDGRGDRSLVGECDCRKPKPGLFLQIAERHGIDLSKALMI